MKRLLVPVLLFIAIAAAACTSNAAPGGSSTTPPAPVIPTEFVPSAVPVSPTYDGCYYVWASQDLPELSRKLNVELQNISKDVTGLAYAYGENCVYADGHQTFSAKETDFRVGVKVTTVKDEATLGDWISKVMPIVLALPEDQLQGPQQGRVDFDFKQPDPAELFVTVPIDKYLREADDLKGADLLHLFLPNP
jgi:hypothetical protein